MTDILEQVPTLQGFDPLAENAASAGDERLFEEATKRIVQNILKSYTGYFDIFSELIQNSLDAIDAAKKADPDMTGRLWITIDIPSSVVAVADNGVGMSERELRYCFRPSVSFKSRRESRGHKGVGATFLGYGFNNIQIATRRERGELAVQLSNGRSWAEDFFGTISRPKLELVPFKALELNNEPSGTRVEISIGEGHRPDLSWWMAQNARQWLPILCMRTPLGGVYLTGRKAPNIHVYVDVISTAGDKTHETTERAEYFFPHEMPGLTKVKGGVRGGQGDSAMRRRYRSSSCGLQEPECNVGCLGRRGFAGRVGLLLGQNLR